MGCSRTFSLGIIGTLILGMSLCSFPPEALGDSYFGFGIGAITGSSANLTIPSTTTSGPVPPPGSIIDNLPNENIDSSGGFPFNAEFRMGHWYQSLPWLGWRTVFNAVFEDATVTTYSYSHITNLFPEVCGAGNCYFRTTSYSNKSLFMPGIGWDLLSFRIPWTYAYPYLSVGGANAILPGKSGVNSIGTGFDFSVGVEGNLSRWLQNNSGGPTSFNLFVEYQTQWYVTGMNPTGFFGGVPFILNEVVIGVDVMSK